MVLPLPLATEFRDVLTTFRFLSPFETRENIFNLTVEARMQKTNSISENNFNNSKTKFEVNVTRNLRLSCCKLQALESFFSKRDKSLFSSNSSLCYEGKNLPVKYDREFMIFTRQIS